MYFIRRDFGFGKRSMESEIHEDVVEFIATLKKTEGTPITTDRMLSLVVLSSLWKIVSGEKIGMDRYIIRVENHFAYLKLQKIQ